ncbi:FtsX-like permease family protein [Conexibacter sp. JD483]|uniref:ABC transporter permease n=1 Tax=unclassified Conexibacter TaxID=2627773 RepID=UPI00272915C0|nr:MULTISPECIES: ABC transporter permease [unclassified Conexibacter]MDO8184559.1 ABC transporter permease [Conexibacter sp. CPCC 205706]MDO8197865.1 ABC transporter permease [Conexibacter sp. CPCC 205762]MDR9370089.1 FtsX-like permease family protein [Conexibacter sp. JD483]
MLSLSLRGLVSRKLRTALTMFAVVLGVGLVAGTYVVTDSMNNAFDDVFQTANENIDVSVTPREQFSGAGNVQLSDRAVSAAQAVPGVRLAVGTVSSSEAVIYTKDGRDPLISGGGAPMILNGETPRELTPLNYVEGHEPTAPDEVSVTKSTADKGDFKLGDTVKVSADGPARDFRLVGIAKFGDKDTIAGAMLAIVQTPVAQELLGQRGEYDSIDIVADQGVSDDALAARVRAALPRELFTVRTGEQEARSQASDLQDQLGFLRTFLLAFAAIALFVGAFLIVNTYSITVAQRMREFALLRMIGASRRQVLRAVLGEAFVVGLVAAVIGLGFGIVIALGLRGLFSSFGAELPTAGLPVEPRTVIVSLLIGTVVTVLSAAGPALRATRVPPIAALQDAASLTRGRTGRLRTPLSIAVAAIGAVLICLGLFGGGSATQSAALIGIGAAVVFVGVGLLASHVVRPLSLLVGGPLEKAFGVSGRLARENSAREPRRTASTASALMIGVTLVAFVAIFASGLKASIDDAVNKGLKGDLVVQSETFQPVPQSASRTLADVPGVGVVSPVRFGVGQVVDGGDKVQISGVDPATVGDVFTVGWKDGSDELLRALGGGRAVVSKGYASDHSLRVGSSFEVLTPTGERVPIEVTGIYDDDSGLLADVTLANETLATSFNQTRDAFVVATTRAGENADAVQKVADRTISADYPTVEVLTKQGFVDRQAGQIDQLITLVYVLLSLSVIVSLFGIVNTLVLSIHERTRELGMLRAIGTSRRQVRQIVRYESVITALIGAVLGVVLGVIFAVLVTIPLKSEGFALSIPILTLVILLVLAAVAGVLAAVLPARRAAKLDVLRALAYE